MSAVPKRSWQESLALACPDFRCRIKYLAKRHGKTIEQVYGWWMEYAKACDAYDQSALLGEFERWYADKLGPVLGGN